MIIIVGLGNPREKYKNTRHNIGFRVLDEFIRRNNFLDLKFSKKFKAEISEERIDKKKVILAKPQTFMNNSGKAVKALINFYKIRRTALLVVHDDIDLLLGKIRIIKNRGAAGHKGVESIINELKTKNFVRFRIGISPASAKIPPGKAKNAEAFVLQKFNKEEKKIVKEIIEKTAEAIELGLKKGIEKAMNEYNQ